MMQTANLGNSNDATVIGLLYRPRQRGVLRQGQMRAGLMVIEDGRSQMSVQAVGTTDEYVT